MSGISPGSFLGRTHTPVTKEKMRLAHLGKRQSEATKRKIGKANWKGGRVASGDGYVLIYLPSHPRSSREGYVFEHIVVLEKKLGRPLVYISQGHGDNEVTHHCNGVKDDNHPDNLEMMLHREHMRYHRS